MSQGGSRGWLLSKDTSQGTARTSWPRLFPPSLLQAAWSWPEVSRVVVGGVVSTGPLPRLPKAGTVGPHSAWASLSISQSLLPTPPSLSLFLPFSLSLFLSLPPPTYIIHSILLCILTVILLNIKHAPPGPSHPSPPRVSASKGHAILRPQP